MFYVHEVRNFACQQFSKAGAAGWVRKFQAMVNWRKFAMSGLPPETDTNRKGRLVHPQLRTCHCTALTDAMCQTWKYQSTIPHASRGVTCHNSFKNAATFCLFWGEL